jgi:hypothetical protein
LEKPCSDAEFSGNIDCDPGGIINILDIITLINFKYKDQRPLCCLDVANVDGDPEGNTDLLDILALIDNVYISGAPTALNPSDFNPPDDTVIIVDNTGKPWDITYGIHYYDLDKFDYNFGQGPFSFLPIIDPDFLSPGDPGYPEPNLDFRVLGVTIDSDSRAYRLNDLIGHEVVDDRFDTVYVAPAY